MDLTETTFSALNDELEKIAAGWARSGKTPIKPTNLLGRDNKFVKKQFMNKAPGLFKGAAMSNTKKLLTAGATGGAIALIGERKMKKAVEDYRTGREFRKAQEG